MNKISVTYGLHKKLLNKCDINEEFVRKVFGISSELVIFFQYFDIHENDYFDLEDIDKIPDFVKKIMILKECSPSDTRTLSPTASTADTIILERDERSFLNISESENIPFINEIIIEDCNPKMQRDDNNVSNLSTSKRSIDMTDGPEETLEDAKCSKLDTLSHDSPTCSKNERCGETKFISQYKLPSFKSDSLLYHALTNHEPLKKSLKGKLLDIIYKDVSKPEIMNSNNKYEYICNSLFNTYPHLMGSMTYEDTKNIYKSSLRNKFYNAKARDLSTKIARESRKVFKSLGERYGIPNYAPSILQEDDNSELRIIEMMKEEVKKKKILFGNLKTKMKASYNYRRNLTLKKDTTPEIIKDMYPALKFEEMIEVEMENMFGKNYFPRFTMVKEPLASLLNVELTYSKSKFKLWFQSLINKFNISQLQQIQDICLLGNVAIFLKEDPSFIIGTEVVGSSPFLLLKPSGKLSLMVNKEEFVTEVSTEKAVFVWTSIFSILDLQVPLCSRKTYAFLMYAVFGSDTSETRNNQAIFKLKDAFNKICNNLQL